jgi:tRNA(fMet)-specific endonuclease VapC
MRSKPSKRLVQRVSTVAVAHQATTSITLGELRFGAAKARRPDLYARALEMLSGVRVLDFDRAAAEVYGDLRASLQTSGTPLDDPDLRIASIAIAHQAKLVTGNMRHFRRIATLDAEDWIR